jgi:hypothetical protein
MSASCQQDATSQQTPRQEIVATFSSPAKQNQTTQEQRAELRRQLDVFYTKKPAMWHGAREKILRMGDIGVEALSIFMLKFFAAGRDNTLVAEISDPSEYWQAAQKELVALGGKAVPYILVQMAHPRLGTTGRMLCALTLSQIGKPAVPILLDNLDKESSVFRRMVLEALGNIGDATAVPAIAALYRSLLKDVQTGQITEDNTADVRQYAVRALGKIKSAQGLTTLQEALEDANADVVAKTMEALLMFHCREALPVLEKALRLAQGVHAGYQAQLRHAVNRIQSHSR